MGEPYVEMASEAVNYLTNTYWDKAYDKVTGNNRQENDQPPQSSVGDRGPPRDSAVSGNVRRRQKNRLPSPEGDAAHYYSSRRDSRRSSSFDKESEYSERVIRNYEAERSDPRRKAETVLSKKDLRQLRRDSKMSYANGGQGYGQNLNTYPPNQRPSSAQPPRSRYNDDDEYGSDYDERNGGRYRTTGRGYDDYDNDGRPYAREVIETERYRGVSGMRYIHLHCSTNTLSTASTRLRWP